MANKAAKNTKTATQAAELSALQNRPTRHLCMSPKCPTPRDAILLKDLQPAGEPKKSMKMYHKACYKSL